MFASLVDVHLVGAYFVIISNTLAGAWSLGAHWLVKLRQPALWWFTAFAEACVFIQVGLGVTLMSGQHKVAPSFHYFYGFFAILTVGGLYAYRQSLWHRLYMLYGFGGLFLAGLGIRAVIIWYTKGVPN